MKNLIARWRVQDAIEVRVQNIFGRCAIKWFKHDADASIDAKLQELLLDYGAAGYGLYWYCVELIAKDVTPKNITFELEHDVRIIARNLNLSIKEVEDMMRKMISLKLFDISNNNKIACVKLAYRLDDSMRKGRQIEEILTAFNNENNLVGKIPSDSGKSLSDIDKDIEEDKRKKINTREELISDFKELDPTYGTATIELAEWFFDYRKKIKKPIKTAKPIKLFIDELRNCIKAGFDHKAVISLIESKEWQSVKAEWVQKEFANQTNGNGSNSNERNKSKVDTTMDAYRALCEEREQKNNFIEGEVV